MNEAPDWLKEPHKKILVAFKRLGGRGHIADVRTSSGKAPDAQTTGKAAIVVGMICGGGWTEIE